MGFKHKTGKGVWIVFMGEVEFGIVMERYLEKKKPVYDVRLVEPGEDPVEIAAGNGGYIEASGWAEWRCHEKKKFAAMEIYNSFAADHSTMGRILQKSAQYFEDPDALLKHLEQIEICSIKEVL
jgi:hypothetical protein